MQERIKFTIAIPAYKPNFLKQAIESIINQTYLNWELIILDDDSPYNLELIVNTYLHDKRIKLYRNGRNVGIKDVVNNWNKCLNLSTGDYLICMGDDDILSHNCLSVYYDYITRYPDYDLYHAATEIIDEESNFLRYQEGRPIQESVYSMAWFRLDRKRDQYIGDFLFKTKTLYNIGGFYNQPMAWASDDITSYLCGFSKGVINIQEYIFKYRENRLSLSNSKNLLLKLEAIRKEEEWYKEAFSKAQPQNDVDKNFRSLIISNISSKIEWKILSTLAYNTKNDTLNTIRDLISKRKKLQIKYSLIMKGLLMGIALKLIRK